MKPFADRYAEDARLVMLKELGLQIDGRLNEVSLKRVLAAFAVTRSRDWVRNELAAMAELGAVTLSEAGTVMIAKITKAGREHLELERRIIGIAQPSDDS
ncbi:hypothetical protein [Sphingomonas sp. VNH70]|uniref:VpaChn25_0724 family phage protein n=1 Tax=Sphingomonas silueang TaxID=3156617 RepID=UPI0032B5744F